MCIYLSFVFVGCAAVPAEADLGGASPAASRLIALLRSAGMLGVNGQVWLIPSRCALGRDYITSLKTAVTPRAQSVRGKRGTGVSYRKQPRIAQQCNLPRSGGAAPTTTKPRAGEQVKHQRCSHPRLPRSPLWFFLGLPRKNAPVSSVRSPRYLAASATCAPSSP